MSLSRFKCLISFWIFHVLYFFIFRLAFFLVYKKDQPLLLSDSLMAFWIGAKFDLRLVILLSLPLLIFGGFKVFDYMKSERLSHKWALFYSFVWSGVITLYFLDFGFFSYLGTRLNSSVKVYFQNPWISLKMLDQSYPIYAILGLFIFMVVLYYFLIRKIVFSSIVPLKARIKRKSLVLFVFLFVVLGIHGSVSQYPLRWSEAFFSANNFSNSIGLNPLLYFFDTYENSDLGFSEELTKKYCPSMAAYLKINEKACESLQIGREQPSSRPRTKPNIVFIVMESLSYPKTSFSQPQLDPTPFIKKLAKRSFMSEEFYVPVEGTARSMFALTTGLPDVNSSTTASRNPLSVRHKVVMNSFKDYEKFYFLGGSASWANIRAVFTSNIDNINVFEEQDYTSPRIDVWGISDLDLLQEAHKVFEEQKKPFAAVIQLAGFHRPYTIPENRMDFKLDEVSSEEVTKFGFNSVEEYHSIKFSDYAVKEFFKKAQQKEYYKNTLFIIIGDHGLPDGNAEHLSEAYKKFSLSKFHVPLIIHGPAYYPQAIRSKEIITEMDLMPSVAALIGQKITNYSLGRDRLTNTQDKGYAFNYFYYSGDMALFSDEHYISKMKEQEVKFFNRQSGEELVIGSLGEEQRQELIKMENLMKSFYETTRYLLITKNHEKSWK